VILRVPRRVLMPLILGFSMIGAFAVNNTAYGIVIMLAFGVLGFLMEENDIPVAPCILGLVLGPMIEENFVTSMIKSDGSFLAFFERPIAGVLGVFTILVVLSPLIGMALRRMRRPATNAACRRGGLRTAPEE